MRAFRITIQGNGNCVAQPLPLPALYRKGDVPAEFYRRQASGESPPADLKLSPSPFVRSIVLDDGRMSNLASGDGALLTFVISGSLTLAGSLDSPLSLESGDLLLVDSAVAPKLDPVARDGCRLIQAGVEADWPGGDAEMQPTGTIHPKSGGPNIKRVLKDVDGRAYFTDFPELFAAAPNEWTPPKPVTGFRFMCWEDGFIDWHPEVINCLAIILSGELELETGGRGGGIELFRAGDICMAEDRTGEGHIDRARGVMHVGLFIIETEDLW